MLFGGCCNDSRSISACFARMRSLRSDAMGHVYNPSTLTLRWGLERGKLTVVSMGHLAGEHEKGDPASALGQASTDS